MWKYWIECGKINAQNCTKAKLQQEFKLHWYLVKTKPNAHFQASEQLKRQNLRVFLPMISRTLKKMGRFVNQPAPLFPGYLFVSSPSNQIPWRSVNATRGVSKAVTLGGRYHEVSIEIIESIKSRCDENDFINIKSEFREADCARIEQGPFTDFFCQVEKITESRRAWVLIETMQKKIRAEVSLESLVKLD